MPNEKLPTGFTRRESGSLRVQIRLKGHQPVVKNFVLVADGAAERKRQLAEAEAWATALKLATAHGPCFLTGSDATKKRTAAPFHAQYGAQPFLRPQADPIRDRFLGRRAPCASGRVHAAGGRSRPPGRTEMRPGSRARLPVILPAAAVGSRSSASCAIASAWTVECRVRPRSASAVGHCSPAGPPPRA